MVAPMADVGPILSNTYNTETARAPSGVALGGENAGGGGGGAGETGREERVASRGGPVAGPLRGSGIDGTTLATGAGRCKRQ